MQSAPCCSHPCYSHPHAALTLNLQVGAEEDWDLSSDEELAAGAGAVLDTATGNLIINHPPPARGRRRGGGGGGVRGMLRAAAPEIEGAPAGDDESPELSDLVGF